MAQSHRRGPGSIPGQTMWDLWWTSVVTCHYHSTHAPYSSSSTSTGRHYQDRQANLPKSSALWEIVEHWEKSTLISLWISTFKGLSWMKKRTISHSYLYSCFHNNFSRNISSNSIVYTNKLANICFWYCSQQLVSRDLMLLRKYRCIEGQNVWPTCQARWVA